MKRFGVSLEEDLLEELDRLARRHKLPNRSQAIRYLIKKGAVGRKWQDNQTVSGCIVLVYDHHKRDLLKQLVSIQHDYENVILCSQHVHLDHAHCMETIMMKGRARQVRQLADRLIAVKGIAHGEMVASVTG